MPKKNTQKSDIIIAAVAAGVVVYSAVSMIRIHKQETAKRKQIDIDMNLELDAIAKASEQVRADIDAGKYDINIAQGNVFQKMNDDMTFYRIVNRPVRSK
jgi:hypothetical protein